ncbi:DNA mismatch repair protein Mlh1 [Hamiltosporidium magnivora]|uniref:DNA mismatch repair protein Mlh1 n=2 Tax=Hamiltosporidium magnivora TaxID=148818 RepID=A0A4Q9L510_9MICR|nr:DNA mismatch repair protein Mlh1 [Hamiltosporidium magnivora]
MKIIQLPQEIISRISAGEVIIRPYNIIKETLENSLDSGCKNIKINISCNILDEIVISDDGCGINQSDFNLLCERHCTSKISDLEDLFNLSSFGFRGEALASISLVSDVSVLSKRKEYELGFFCEYENTKLKSIKRSASENGTNFFIKNIFKNNRIRKEYFCKRNEEIRDIYDLVVRYSIFYYRISFTLNIDNKNKNAFYSSNGYKDEYNQESLVNNIKDEGKHKESVDKDTDEYNLEASVDKDKYEYNLEASVDKDNENEIKRKMLIDNYKLNENLKFLESEKFKIFFSLPFVNYKKYIFILFINGRLVDQKNIKSAILSVYKPYLPKNTFPFIYIEIFLEKNILDVNVHPCKKEVLFLDEEKFIKEICKEINFKIKNEEICFKKENENKKNNFGEIKEYLNYNENRNDSSKIYTDPLSLSLDEIVLEGGNETSKIYKLESLKKLKNEIEEINTGFFKNLVFVGVMDNRVLIQYTSFLLLCSFKELVEEFLYQRIIYEFGNFEEIQNIEIFLNFTDFESTGICNFNGKGEENNNFNDANMKSTKTLNLNMENSNSNHKKIKFLKSSDQVDSNLSSKKEYNSLKNKEENIYKNINISNQMIGLLEEYFSIKIYKNKIITVPKLLCPITDTKVWNSIINRISNLEMVNEFECLKEIIKIVSEEISQCILPKKIVFNEIKRKIIGTKKSLKTFKVITQLSELYKQFERC